MIQIFYKITTKAGKKLNSVSKKMEAAFLLSLWNFKKGIELAPGFKPAYELAAQIYEQQGNMQQAQQIRAAAAQL